MNASSQRDRDATQADVLRGLLPNTGAFEHREWLDACRRSSVDALAAFLAISHQNLAEGNVGAKRDAARIIASAKISEHLAEKIEALEAAATKLEKRALFAAWAGVAVAIAGLVLAAAQVLG